MEPEGADSFNLIGIQENMKHKDYSTPSHYGVDCRPAGDSCASRTVNKGVSAQSSSGCARFTMFFRFFDELVFSSLLCAMQRCQSVPVLAMQAVSL